MVCNLVKPDTCVIFGFLLFFGAAWPGSVWANNLVISNDISNFGEVDPSTWTLDIRFVISWDNSWRDAGAPSTTANWDAAWVFIKFSTSSDGINWNPWGHASLASSGHTVPTGVQLDLGPTDGVNVGAFLYRDSAGSGSNNWSVELRWNFEADNVSSDTYKRVRVFGIEMVFVSTGSFYVGPDTTDGVFEFYKYPNTGTAFQITSEGAINMGQTNDYLWSMSNGYMQTATLPAAFPKGYRAFYIMKTKVSQRQYVDFLNTLPRSQQNTRTTANVSGDSPASNYTYVMSSGTAMSDRNSIRCPASGNGVTNPITFGCDYDGDGTFNESNDGGWIACNYISWADGAAYADWAGLRPFTELEFEKAARGPATPVADEFVWGAATPLQEATGISNAGTASEGPSNAAANIVYNNNASVQGPLRSGCMARSATNRGEAGAGYYGALDLSGNLDDVSVTLGDSTGRAFDGGHGDGKLDSSGNANVTNWPGTTGTGSGFRGGNWLDDVSYSRLSSRPGAGTPITYPNKTRGFRFSRTSP